jgi:hypothetical protein
MSSPLSFAGVRVLLIDGNNLLHRLSGSAGTPQLRLLLARLRQALPPDVQATLMLDGHPAPGAGLRQRIAANLDVRHAGSRTADDALVDMVRAERPVDRAALVVVSDDRALVERSRMLGARTQRLAWLAALLGGGGAPARATGLGARRAGSRPPPAVPSDDADEDNERVPWQPGRGATRKRGNPRRRPRSQRD